jgi:hypothetical protein
MPTEDNKRQYSIYFYNNILLRGIIFSLEKEGFLPN